MRLPRRPLGSQKRSQCGRHLGRSEACQGAHRPPRGGEASATCRGAGITGSCSQLLVCEVFGVNTKGNRSSSIRLRHNRHAPEVHTCGRRPCLLLLPAARSGRAGRGLGPRRRGVSVRCMCCSQRVMGPAGPLLAWPAGPAVPAAQFSSSPPGGPPLRGRSACAACVPMLAPAPPSAHQERPRELLRWWRCVSVVWCAPVAHCCMRKGWMGWCSSPATSATWRSWRWWGVRLCSLLHAHAEGWGGVRLQQQAPAGASWRLQALAEPEPSPPPRAPYLLLICP